MEPNKAVDDAFLADYYQEPPRGLQQEVYRMISADETIVQIARPRPARRVAFGLLAAGLLLSLGLGASPAARASVISWVRTVAGIGFHENPDPNPPYPIDEELSATAPEPELVLVKELPERLPFALRIPQAPAGYFQSSMASVLPPHPKWPESGWMVTMSWLFDSNDQALISRKQTIRMTVRNNAGKLDLGAGPQMTEEVLVGGQPAALTRGIWLDSGNGMRWQTEQGGNEYLTLSWLDGDLLYQLESDERDFLARLIEMAETIR